MQSCDPYWPSRNLHIKSENGMAWPREFHSRHISTFLRYIQLLRCLSVNGRMKLMFWRLEQCSIVAVSIKLLTVLLTVGIRGLSVTSEAVVHISYLRNGWMDLNVTCTKLIVVNSANLTVMIPYSQMMQTDYEVHDLLICMCFMEWTSTLYNWVKLHSSLIWSMLKLAWHYFSLSPSVRKYLIKAILMVGQFWQVYC